MRRCVIVGGADISDYGRVRGYLRADDYVIFCDSGLKHMPHLGVVPGLIVGDFDSHANPMLDTETIVLPCEKDDTDTAFAAKEAIKRGFCEFLLVGVVGARLDHTLCNLYLLEFFDQQGKKAFIVDDFSEMCLVSAEPEYIDGRFSFFSLINITGRAKGISIQNAKYPLEDAEIVSGCQYGISNEVEAGQRAGVSVKDGKLLLVKVF